MRITTGIVLIVFCISATLPVAAQTVEELRQQLEAQRALNEQLRQRLEEMEKSDSGSESAALLPFDSSCAPLAEPEIPEATTAIQEALVAKGVVLLPPGTSRLAPGLSWIHSGTEANSTRSDDYIASLSAMAGLSWGMVTASIPYVHRDTEIDSNSGVGDMSMFISTELMQLTEQGTSLVGTVGYQEQNGKDPFAQVPIGSGFRVLSVSFSVTQRIDPVVLYGDIFYAYPLPRDVAAENLYGEPAFVGRITPGHVYGVGLGASLAVTPDITFDVGLSVSYVGSTEISPEGSESFHLPRATIASFKFGSGFIVSKNLSLLLSASVGASTDAPDFSFSASFPYRF